MTEDGPRSQAGGAAVLAAAAAGLGVGFYHLSNDLFVAVVWVAGWSWMVKVARTANPAPPQPPKGVTAEEPQVSFEQDPDNPQHWIRKTGTP